MIKKDYSKEIFKKYFNSKDQILEITLKDNTVLEGIFFSYFYGNENIGEPFIIKWHFMDKNEIPKHNSLISIDWGESFGRIINQKDIKRVRLKVVNTAKSESAV